MPNIIKVGKRKIRIFDIVENEQNQSEIPIKEPIHKKKDASDKKENEDKERD